MRKSSAVLSALLIGSLLVVTGIATTGCGEKKPEKLPLTADPIFSVNVIPVPAFWPRENFDWSEDENLRILEKSTYEEYGAPDYIRLVHTFDRRIVREAELLKDVVLAGRRPKPIYEWIYMDRKLVLQFNGPQVVEAPLTDKLKIVCEYGDPVAVRNFNVDGIPLTSFYYYNHGKEFVFNRDDLVQVHSFNAMPGAERMRE